MSSPYSRSLPSHPDIAQQRKQAKELLESFTAGDAEARARVRAALPDKKDIALADAPVVIAREYGFTNWAALKQHIQTRADHGRPPEEPTHDAFQRRAAGASRPIFDSRTAYR